MKIYLFVLTTIFLMACASKNKNQVGMYTINQPVDVVKSQDGGTFYKKDSVLIINTTGNGEYPGIIIRGQWDLSKCNKLIVELENYESRGVLPITVRLLNPKADIEKNKGVFIDRVRIPTGSSKQFEIKLPPKLPYPEVAEKFSGMRSDPYYILPGIVSNIDLADVVEIALYVSRPQFDWEWGVKRIIAKTGAKDDLSDWVKMSPKEFFPFIDRYGQFIHKDWSGKTKSDQNLKNAFQEEQGDLKNHPGPLGRSLYGGWKDGPKQEATGHFYVKKIDDKWWIVDPEGYLFWSHGAVRVTLSSGITPLDNREFYFKDLPDKNDPQYGQFYTLHDELLYPYYLKRNIREIYNFSAANIMRKYGDNWKDKFADIVHTRFKSWGLNTIANSSDKYICIQDKTPYCERFELKSPNIEGSHDGWWKFKDPFHSEFKSNLHQQLLERKDLLDDPWCLGFFVDNELSWGSETSLAEWTLQSPSTQPAKIELIRLLKEKYKDIAVLNDKWNANYLSWDALLQSKEKPSVDSKEDCMHFTDIIVESYFKYIREEFKRIAPNKLYMGCRFAGKTTERVLKHAAKYCDVLSYNIYTYSLENFKLPEGIDKPIMIGEFHFGALDRGLFHTGLVATENQEARANAYATYVESALRHPNFIGTHWHQYSDQATTGRFDGENFQVGFTDICDRPYLETIRKIREVGYNMYTIRNGQ